MEAWQLRRGPFGYTPRSVRLVLADRDRSLVEAWERAKAAEAQVLAHSQGFGWLVVQLDGEIPRPRRRA